MNNNGMKKSIMKWIMITENTMKILIIMKEIILK